VAGGSSLPDAGGSKAASPAGVPADAPAWRPPASVSGAATGGPPESPLAQTPISSEDWQRIARDPLVQRFQQAVDGTLFSARRIAPPPSEAVEPETDADVDSEPDAESADEPMVDDGAVDETKPAADDAGPSLFGQP